MEDIERNIRTQQIQNIDLPKTQTSPQHQRAIGQQSFSHSMPPPGLTGNKNPIFPPSLSPIGMQKMSPGSGGPRIPPGFPYPLPPHFNALSKLQNIVRLPGLPNPMANYPLHPNLIAMRSNTPRIGQQAPMPQHMQMQQQFNQQNSQNMQQQQQHNVSKSQALKISGF